ncbi:alpha-amylase family glycosyl hydrolase [Vallitalea sediminicola]
MNKKFGVIFILLLTISLVVSGCTTSKEKISTMENSPNGVWYEIFVRAFADSDGDGVGDINGVIEKLDYLNDNDSSTNDDLGINGIWLMPINPSPSYHGYDITDYYDINPDYGTLDDFEHLLEEAHKRNIKVIMDLVLNHSSSKHPWFVEAVGDENSAYRDYYDIVPEDSEEYDFDKQVWGHNAWNKIGSNYYYAIFWDGMPDFNYSSETLRDEMVEVATYWLEKGVDGFRVDAVPHIFGVGELPKNDDYDSKTREWWQEFDTALRKVKADYYLVGEVWESIEKRSTYASNFNTTFNFDLSGEGILGMVKFERDFGRNNNGLITQLDMVYSKMNEYNDHFIDAPFLSNHDTQRAMDYLNGDLTNMKLAASLYMTLPGNPFIYYGEEIGMKGNKPDENIREPFIWGENDSYQSSWESLNSNKDTSSVSSQEKDKDSLLNYYRKIIRIRQSHPALMAGELIGIETSSSKVVAYERKYLDERLVVVHNLYSKEIEIDRKELEKEYKLGDVLFCNQKEPLIEDNTIELPGKCSIIFKVK